MPYKNRLVDIKISTQKNPEMYPNRMDRLYNHEKVPMPSEGSLQCKTSNSAVTCLVL